MKEIFDTYPLPWSFDDDLAVVVASNGEAVCEFYASGLEDQDALHQDPAGRSGQAGAEPV